MKEVVDKAVSEEGDYTPYVGIVKGSGGSVGLTWAHGG